MHSGHHQSRSVSPTPLSPVSTSEKASPVMQAENDVPQGPQEAQMLMEPSAEKTGHSSRRKSVTSLFTETWTGEFIAWTAATICIVVIATILIVFRDSQLDRWHSQITINTLINFLSQLAQSALAVTVAAAVAQLKWIWFCKTRRLGAIDDFDKVTNQPSHSILLLFRYPKWPLAYLAAINPILILLLGPFAQQSVSIEPRSVASVDGVADIPAVAEFQLPDTVNQVVLPNERGELTNNTWTFNSTSLAMKGEVMQGIVGLAADLSDVRARCETANCTFQPYTTVGVCSSVENATQEIITDCVLRADGEYCSYNIHDLREHPPFRLGNSTDNELWVAASAHSLASDPGNPPQAWGVGDTSTEGHGGSYQFPAIQSIAEFYVLYPRTFGYVKNVTGLVKMRALKSTLSLCLYTLQTTVRSGRTDTSLIKIHEDVDWRSDANETHRGHITTSLPDGSQYSIDSITMKGLTNYLTREVLYGKYVEDPEPDFAGADEFATTDIAKAFGRAIYDKTPNGFVAKDRSDGVRSLLDNLSLRMTNVMRTTSQNVTQFKGTPLTMKLFIAVDFYWLILPVITILLVLLMLVIVIIHNRVHDLPAWKSSQIHTVCVLEPDAREEVRTDKEMAKEMKVRLRKDDGGLWRLQQELLQAEKAEQTSSQSDRLG